MDSILWSSISVFLFLCLFNETIGAYSYGVSLTTIARWTATNTGRQHFLTDHQIFPTDDNFLRFRVLGKSGVRLFLESTKKDSSPKRIYYYIFIGNESNTRSAILLVNSSLSNHNFYSKHRNADAWGPTMSATEWREFWISWYSGNIKVGKGPEYNQNLMMSWTNPCPFKIFDIGITSGPDLRWEFQLYSPIDNNYPLGRNCNSYIRTQNCPPFITLTSSPLSRHGCSLQCSDDDDCWGWDYNDPDGTCKLLSGEPEQIDLIGQEGTALFLKQ